MPWVSRRDLDRFEVLLDKVFRLADRAEIMKEALYERALPLLSEHQAHEIAGWAWKEAEERGAHVEKGARP